jgi:hypothetical protein
MVIGDRIKATKRSEDKQMAQPLHTDDPNAVGNLSAEDYQRQWEERAARLGDAGLHTIPDAVIEAIELEG